MFDLRNIKVLIVTEKFLIGGLETQLADQINYLSKKNVDIYIAIGEYVDYDILPTSNCKGIFTELKFSPKATSSDLMNAVSELEDIISKNKIDIVHAHPFHSCFAAFIAATNQKVPVIYTLHGPASIMEHDGQFADIFVKHALIPNSYIIAVSHEMLAVSKNFTDAHKIKFLPNSVDTSVFSPVFSTETYAIDTCCIISRLDSIKTTGIKIFIENYVGTIFKEVHIIGDGPATDELKTWISEKKISGNIIFKGVSSSVEKDIIKYAVVAGMGRAALEASAMGKTVILLGYDGVKGILNINNVNIAQVANFSGRNLENVSPEILLTLLNNADNYPDKYNLRDWVIQFADSDKTWTSYKDWISKLRFDYVSPFVTDLLQILLNHKSNIPFLEDFGLLTKVKSMLRSTRYIETAIYKYTNDFDTRLTSLAIESANTGLKDTQKKIDQLTLHLAAIDGHLDDFFSRQAKNEIIDTLIEAIKHDTTEKINAMLATIKNLVSESSSLLSNELSVLNNASIKSINSYMEAISHKYTDILNSVSKLKSETHHILLAYKEHQAHQLESINAEVEAMKLNVNTKFSETFLLNQGTQTLINSLRNELALMITNHSEQVAELKTDLRKLREEKDTLLKELDILRTDYVNSNLLQIIFKRIKNKNNSRNAPKID